MYTFKQFVLKEELNDQEKKEVSAWKRDPKAVKATDHFFGKGNDEKTEELAGTVDKSEVHKAVEGHLGQEIHPDDYKEGVTNDKYGRKVKIGGILAKSKADPKLINSFANDSTRQGKRAKGLSVKITRSPAGVAGQTSHNQSWEDQSCKNYNTGSNRHYLKNEVKHGTVVAYLHDHEGKEIARTTLQPHINDEGHTAYDVDSHYGIDHAGFKQHAKNLAKRLSGEHKGGSLIYTKHSKVYNDNRINNMIHPNTSKEDIDKYLNDKKSTDARRLAISHPNATKEHIDKALNDENSLVRMSAIQNKNATKEHIDKALNDEDQRVRAEAIKHPNATKEHIDKATNDKEPYVRSVAIRHPNATKEHIDKALNDKDMSVRHAAIRHPNATKEHIDKALNDKDASVRAQAIQRPNATKEHIDKALNDKNPSVRYEAISHPNATKEHIDKALNDKDPYVRTIANYKKIQQKRLNDKALNDKHPSVRTIAAQHPNATKEHMDKALNVKESYVRTIAITKKYSKSV